MPALRLLASTSFIGLALGLAACGFEEGGGRGYATAAGLGGTVGFAPQAAAAGTGETKRNWGFAAIGADAALGQNATGRGETVAVIDGAVKTDLPDLKGRVAGSFDAVRGRGYVPAKDPHATFVAGLIGARRNGRGIVGVASGAKLVSIDASTPCWEGAAEKCFAPDDLGRALAVARARKADVVNMSLGGPVPVDAVREALGRTAASGAIVVMAAGNEGTRLGFPGAFAPLKAMRGRAIVVGAVDRKGKAPSWSNRATSLSEAGVMLMAPGVDVTGLDLKGGLARDSGTSFAAPHVAGAAAVVGGRFSYLKPEEVVEVLLVTARDAGPKGVDLTYGRGILDLEAALKPVGRLSVKAGGAPARGQGGGSGGDARAARLSLGGQFAPLDLGDAVAFDAFGRAYPAHLDARTERRGGGGRLARRIAPPVRGTGAAFDPLGLELGFTGMTAVYGDEARRDFDATNRPDLRASAAFGFADGGGGTWQAAVGDASLALAAGGVAGAGDGPAAGALLDLDPFLALTESGFGLAQARGLGPFVWRTALHEARSPAEDGEATLLRNDLALPLGPFTLGLGHALLREDGAALGSGGTGALDVAKGATSQFGTSGIGLRLGAVDLRATALVGATAVEDRRGIVGDWSRVTTSGWSLAAGGADVLAAGDRLTLTVGQPLRVERGSATLSVPVGRDEAGTVLAREERVSLAPKGRETRLELAYERPLSEGASLAGWTWLRHEPDHDGAAADDVGVGLRLSQAF
ncbi:MAG: S8 family serine peptidase [Geminicoccaceae bacterium]|nr:S8 family serine peptidase [Geminicoccaceae bacterium]